MLKIVRRSRTVPSTELPLRERPELQIRNLLDDPALRRAMGLGVTELPQRRFDRRRLLDAVAA